MKVYKELRNAYFKILGDLFGYFIEIKWWNRYLKAVGGSTEDTPQIIKHMKFSPSKGEKRNYYILRYNYPLMGIGALMRDMVLIDKRSLFRGQDCTIVPHFDLYTNLLNSNYGKTINNLWDEYFVSLSIKSLIHDDKNDNNILLSPVNAKGGRDIKINASVDNAHHYCANGQEGVYLRSRFRSSAKELYVFRSEIKKEWDDEWNTLLTGYNGKILGVLMREEFSNEHLSVATDDEHKKVLAYHPVLPTVDETISIVKDKMEEWGCNSIFLSTLYEPTIYAFVHMFGDRSIVYVSRRRLDNYKDDCADDLFPTKMNFKEKDYYAKDMNMDLYHERTYTYLKELYFLSKCSCFISGVSSGGFVVPLLREKEFDSIYYLT